MDFLQTLWAYILSSSPYLMLGLFLSGVVKQFLSPDFITRNLGQNGLGGVLKATLVGIPMPLCSCAVIPTSVTLKKSGASNGATSAFLIATPESGIDSVLMTRALMDLPMTIIRPLAAFMSAMAAGFLQLLFNPSSPEVSDSSPSCCHKKEEVKKGVLWEVIHYGFYQLLKDMSIWLTVGLILGAAIMYFVPQELFLNLSLVQGKMIVLVLGIPLYICASATTPIAAALILKGMSPGTALLLLLLGPATNLSNLMVMQQYIGKKGVIINLVAITSVSLVLSFLTDVLYQLFQWEIPNRLEEHMHRGGWWHLFAVILSCLFVALLLVALAGALYEKKKSHS